jgi:hypothetical protein
VKSIYAILHPDFWAELPSATQATPEVVTKTWEEEWSAGSAAGKAWQALLQDPVGLPVFARGRGGANDPEPVPAVND